MKERKKWDYMKNCSASQSEREATCRRGSARIMTKSLSTRLKRKAKPNESKKRIGRRRKVSSFPRKIESIIRLALKRAADLEAPLRLEKLVARNSKFACTNETKVKKIRNLRLEESCRARETPVEGNRLLLSQSSSWIPKQKRTMANGKVTPTGKYLLAICPMVPNQSRRICTS